MVRVFVIDFQDQLFSRGVLIKYTCTTYFRLRISILSLNTTGEVQVQHFCTNRWMISIGKIHIKSTVYSERGRYRLYGKKKKKVPTLIVCEHMYIYSSLFSVYWFTLTAIIEHYYEVLLKITYGLLLLTIKYRNTVTHVTCLFSIKSFIREVLTLAYLLYISYHRFGPRSTSLCQSYTADYEFKKFSQSAEMDSLPTTRNGIATST